MPDQFRPLRNGTHRSGNIYFADTPEGVDDDEGQVGYIRDGRLARAMVRAYNASLAATSGHMEPHIDEEHACNCDCPRCCDRAGNCICPDCTSEFCDHNHHPAYLATLTEPIPATEATDG